MPAEVTKVEVRRHVSSARETPIDGYLADADVLTLYEKWNESLLGEMLKFRGGLRGITAEMVADADDEDLISIYGDDFAQHLIKVAEENKSSY